MRMRTLGITICTAALLASVAHSAAPSGKPASKTENVTGPAAQSSFLRQLAGTGGKVSFRTGRFGDGTPGWFHLGPDPANPQQQLFEAEGSIELKTPDMNLNSGKLDFQMETGVLHAERDVRFKSGEVEASCGNLEYAKETGSAKLTGNPDVLQKTAQNTAHFNGMDVFSIRRDELNQQLVELSGARTIKIEIKSVKPDAGASGKPADSPAKDATGLNKLGTNLTIEVAPAAEREPRVRSIVAPGGELSVFTAAGSVVLTSDQFNLRCDDMMYNAADKRFEAVGNVYFMQDTVEADCGRLQYELDSGKITLTGDPDVRRYEPGGVTHITKYDIFTIEPHPGGPPDLKGIGDGLSEFTPTSENAPKPNGPQTRPNDAEIPIAPR